MRIVMVCDDVRIDRRILQEAETLITEGHEVILLAAHAEGWPKHERIGSVKVERLCAPPGGVLEWGLQSAINLVKRASSRVARIAQATLIVRPLRFALRLNYRIRRATMRDRYLANRIAYYNPDCIHVHDLPQLRAGAMTQRRLSVPLIYDAHELYPDIGTLSLCQRITLRRRERRYIKGAAVTITVNPLLANVMERRYGLRKVESILNAVNPPAGFDPRESHDRFRDVLPIPPGARIVLFQGGLSAERGLLSIVEALPAVPSHVHVVFMGYGDEGANLVKRASELGVTPRVHVMDAVPQDDLIFWSASADVGIIPYPLHDPNHRLCSPNKLCEFIQAGVPLLANDSAYVRRVVAGERIGLVCRLEAATDFAKAITEICSSDEKLERIRQRILQVQDKYRWDAQGAQLLKIYRSVVPQHMQDAA